MDFINVQNVVSANQYFNAEGAAYIEFINNGDGVVLVDKVQVLPFGSFAPVPPVSGDRDYTQYTIEFLQPFTLKNLVVTRKFYNT